VVATNDMTVVSVYIEPHIRGVYTPVGMPDRIPPRTPSPFLISVTPSLVGSGGQYVEFAVDGQSADNGTVTINGSGSPLQVNEKTTRSIDLSSPDGSTQTNPGHAGQLRLTARVRGQDALLSDGFSVAAVPTNVSVSLFSRDLRDSLLTHYFPGTFGSPRQGIIVKNEWLSDSGNLSDLSLITVDESIDLRPGSGSLAKGVHIPQPLNESGTAGATLDMHAVPLKPIRDYFARTGRIRGYRAAFQVLTFTDSRLGSTTFAMRHSGFLITQIITKSRGKFILFTQKQGAGVVVNHFRSDPGFGRVNLKQNLAL
jgi:hypothetical protein